MSSPFWISHNGKRPGEGIDKPLAVMPPSVPADAPVMPPMGSAVRTFWVAGAAGLPQVAERGAAHLRGETPFMPCGMMPAAAFAARRIYYQNSSHILPSHPIRYPELAARDQDPPPVGVQVDFDAAPGFVPVRAAGMGSMKSLIRNVFNSFQLSEVCEGARH